MPLPIVHCPGPGSDAVAVTRKMAGFSIVPAAGAGLVWVAPLSLTWQLQPRPSPGMALSMARYAALLPLLLLPCAR